MHYIRIHDGISLEILCYFKLQLQKEENLGYENLTFVFFLNVY